MAFKLRTPGELEAFTKGKSPDFFFAAAHENLQSAKSAMQQGNMTLADFFTQAPPLLRLIHNVGNQITTMGSSQASYAKSKMPLFVDFVSDDAFFGVRDFKDVRAPFTSREFTTLPRETLPTREQINTGVIPVDLLPPGAFEKVAREERLLGEEQEAERVQQEEDERQKAIAEGRIPTDGSLPDPTDSGDDFSERLREIALLPGEDQQAALDELVSGITQSRENNRIGSTLDRIAQLEPGQQEDALLDLVSRLKSEAQSQEASERTIRVPDPQNPGRFIDIPVVGDVDDRIVPQSQDQSVIEAEARRQEEQRRREFEAVRALRDENLQGLDTLLQTNRERSFREFVPQAAEQLQTKGLLQTSELENVLGKEQGRLQEASENLLSQARLASSEQEVGAISDILAQRQGLQLSGLERFFSEKDAKRQEELARSLGQGQVQTSGASGTLQGAAAGAAAGAPLGPLGIAGGALAGGIAGNNK